MPSKFKIIKKPYELKKVIKYCKQTGYASIDFETNALHPSDPLFYPTILGISFQPGSSYILPLAHFDSPFKEANRWKRLLHKFGTEVIENKDIIKIAWNLKFEYQIFHRYGIEMSGRLLDGMLAKYLLDEERPNDLKNMVTRYIPEFANYQEDYEGSKLPWDQKPLLGLSQYCGLDCDVTLRLMVFFEDRLIQGGFYTLFRNMMMMGTRVLAESEYQGMPIDMPYLENLVEVYKDKIADNDDRLRNNPRIKKFQRWLINNRKQKLISKVSEEINDLYDEIKELKKQRKKEKDEKEKKKLKTAINRKKTSIKGREDKIDRYKANVFTTKNELKVQEEVNFSSPQQMVELFFTSPKGFRFPIIKYSEDKKNRDKKGNPSTDESVLLELQEKDKSGFIEDLLNHRAITKLNSTYIVGVQKKVTEGHVHGRFNLHGTVTGRLSSNDPNLQNIPRDTTASDIKPMFIPPPGYLLLQLDYSQAELRVMAAMAGEENMIKWFKEGKDIHLTVALKKERCEERYDEIKAILEKEDDNDPEFKIWKVRRKAAKTINFGIIYGQGASKLAATLGWSVEEAKKFLEDYFKLFPKIRKFIKKQYRFAHKNAYVRNVFGRKRRLWKIDSDATWEVAEAERQSVNAPIQGAASDYTLFSSILIWEQIRNGLIPIDKPQCYTVHDSLGYFVKADKVHEIVPKLEAICADPQTKKWFGFQIDDVKMKVDFEVSHENWGKLKTYHPETDYTALVA